MYTVFSRYYKFKLTTEEKQVYDSLVGGLERRESEINTPFCPIDSFNKILFAINFDNPHLYYVNFAAIRGVFSPFSCKFNVSYLIDEAMQQNLDSRLTSVVAGIVKQVEGKSSKDAALLLHDWLVSNCTYGECNTIPNASHSIVGPFLYSTCVCEGYAKAYKYLLDLIKLRAIVVTGEGIHPDGSSGGHAWNIIKLDRICYYVDVTFDLLFAGKYCSRAYFMLSTKDILYDHKVDKMFEMPDCPYNGNVLKIVSGTAELLSFFNSEYHSGATYSEVRLTKGFTGDKLMSMIKNKMSFKDFGWYNKIKTIAYGDYSRTLFVCWK